MGSLAAYSQNTVDKAVEILLFGDLYRAEKVKGPAMFLQKAHKANKLTKRRRINRLWAMAYEAPPGFCHAKTTMIGTLLDDLQNNDPNAEENFKRKMHPLKYQRPTTVKQGNIVAADKFIEDNGYADSFKRKFATFDDVAPRLLWTPREEQKKKVGLFSSTIEVPEVKEIYISDQVKEVTWFNFSGILSQALKIEVKLENKKMPFVGILTEAVRGSKPILQWDLENNRNPLSHFFFHTGSTPSQWGMTLGWQTVDGIMYAPWMHTIPEATHFSPFAIFVMKKMRCSVLGGSAIFPEHLKSEFHHLRGTIEAYSEKTNARPAAATRTPGANGLATGGDYLIRVTMPNSAQLFRIDRWN
jgi:hypothetical protein